MAHVNPANDIAAANFDQVRVSAYIHDHFFHLCKHMNTISNNKKWFRLISN